MPDNEPAEDRSVRGNLIKPAKVETDSHSTEEMLSASDVSDAYGVKVIDPGVSDIGSAVNTAISELAPEGGKIQLPKGEIPLSTAIDLSDGANGLENSTPIIIEGHGAHVGIASGNEAGTTLDCSGLSNDHGIKTTGTGRSHIYLRDFTLTGGPSGYNGVHFGSKYTSQGEIRNVYAKDGWKHGLRLQDTYGIYATGINATRTTEGIRLQRCNASNFGMVTARENTSNTAYAVTIDNGVGLEIDNLYIESNDGSALEVTGGTTGENIVIQNLYCENNNRSGDAANTHEVAIADSSVVDDFITKITINAAELRAEANPFGSERFYVDKCGAAVLRALTLSINFHATSAAGGSVYDSDFDEADSNSGRWYWVNNKIGTDNRDAGDTIV